MRILFVADGRSPIALNWIRYWAARGDEVSLVSTFPCMPDMLLHSLDFVPVAFSRTKFSPTQDTAPKKSAIWGASMLSARMAARHWLGTMTLPRAARRLNGIIRRVQPDLVHAMRIPFEGMLAAVAKRMSPKRFPPLVVSVWGNDFTLHAPASPMMRRATRLTLRLADALHADCKRDIRLAKSWGFPDSRPSIVLPGNGGLDLGVFFPPEFKPAGALVVNPRGFRGYVRNDTFFKSIPLVLEKKPEAKFVCPAMADEPLAEKWVSDLGIEDAVTLLPPLPRPQLAAWFRRAKVVVSPSTHDGTPNSLLEGIACGAFPIAGDLDSIREWITPGVNGMLIDPADPRALADAILVALNDDDLRMQAAEYNIRLIAARAEYGRCMSLASEFYSLLLL